MPRPCEVRDLGRMEWREAFALQSDLVSKRKAGRIPDQLLIVEHPHVITMGRNGHEANLLASPELLSRSGIAFYETDRGGDVTYHGPGQIVGYPILDLTEWKRDVRAYVRALEQMMIDTLADFGIDARHIDDLTGVWVGNAKLAAIGVHLSRWITSHGFAFNLDPDLKYFQYIVPCGLTKPVTSMAQLGVPAKRQDVIQSMATHFARIFNYAFQNSPEAEPALAS
jgi:lipoyl(octanoyl) transferase